MKIPVLSHFFKSRDHPQNYTGDTIGGGRSFPFGSSWSGKSVTERSAMQTTTVYACVRILAETLASLPLHIYKYTDKGQERYSDHTLYLLLHDEPNPEMSSFTFRETLMTHLLLWGNAYAQIIRNGKGNIIALYPLLPNKMSVDRGKDNKIYYEYNSDTQGRVVFLCEDILHIPGLGFDGIIGYSPIAMAKNAIGLGIAAEEYGSKFFSNSGTPSGVLEHPGVLKDPSKIRETWNETFGGSSNAHKVAVVEEGMKFSPISVPPNDAQFLETRKFQVTEICRIFRIAPHLVADLEKSSFSNIEQQSLEFVKYTLDPWVMRWEQTMQRVLLRQDEKSKCCIKFNVDGLLRGDYQSRMSGYATGIQNGFYCPNDIRRLENMNLIPDDEGGNKFLCNGNMVDLAHAGSWAHADEKMMEEDLQDG